MHNDLRVTLRAKGYVRQPDGSYSKADSVVAAPCSPEPQPHVEPEPLAAPTIQASGTGRRVLRFTSYRRRLVDPDNNVFKWECDALRYAGILEDDTAEHVEIVTKQVRVGTRAEEGVEIVIEAEAVDRQSGQERVEVAKTGSQVAKRHR